MVMKTLRRCAPILSLTVLMASLAGCAPQRGNKPLASDVLPSQEISHANLRNLWATRLLLEPGEKIRDIWRVSDLLFFATDRNVLICIKASSGERRWNLDLGEQAIRIFRPQISAGDRYVYVTTRGRIEVVDKDTGTLLSGANLGFSVACDPIVITKENFSRIFVGGADLFYGLYVDPLGGREWVQRAQNEYFLAPPVWAADGLFFASSKGKLWRVDPLAAVAGKPSWWDRRVNGDVVAPLTADAARLLVPCSDRQLYSFEASSGNLQWTAQLDGMLDQQAMITPRTILCIGSGKGLYGINPDDGRVKWTLPNVKMLITQQKDHVLAADLGGNVLSILPDTGEVEAKIAGNPDMRYVRNNTDATLYVLTTDGRVAAYSMSK